ncbi:MAG: esterase/lipase family protein [Luteimonas sp.]
MTPSFVGVPIRLATAACLLALLNGCAAVSVKQNRASDADLARRSDVLSTGRLSADGDSTLASAGLTLDGCRAEPEPCAAALRLAVSEETALATIAEVRTLRMEAVAGDRAMRAAPEIAAHEAIDVARWAYAYLFMTARTPEQRVFESRQERVLRLYNHAVEVTAQALFEVARSGHRAPSKIQNVHNLRLHLQLHGFDPDRQAPPEALLASDTLGFDSLRAVYRRDGFGSSLVAVFPRLPDAGPAARGADGAVAGAASDVAEAIDDADAAAGTARGDRGVDAARAAAQGSVANRLATGSAASDVAARPPYRDTRYQSVTSTLRFPGNTLAEVLATEDVGIDVYNPYLFERDTIAGRPVPLAANFSAAYGVWLARSELARLSLSSLLRPRQQTVFDPRVYLTQPYDPDKRVVILIHGLASSPEAWVNLANELLGDEALRRHYQIWQVFYPTNFGILASRSRIDHALRDTFAHFDPQGDDRASHGAVLVGHSMGGVIARLLVSDSGTQVMTRSFAALAPQQAAALEREPLMREMMLFHALPQVGRAVFVAAPHRGAVISDSWAPRLARYAIRLPLAVLNEAAEVSARNRIDAQALQRIGFAKGRPPTGADDLSPQSLLMRTTADLPIEAGLPYHSIVGWRDPSLALAQSSDGAVPYASAHLDGALSEKAIRDADHRVQETPAAIIELRRILRLDMAQDASVGHALPPR